MKVTIRIIRLLTGGVFIFSGIVKAIDPMGSAYKFHDYFQAFHLPFLNAISLTLAIILCAAEFISGFSLITGTRYKTGLWGIIILLAIFTPLTLILAIFNPVTDCGCFGDAIHLSNWQTFGKNVVLSGMAFLLFRKKNETVVNMSNGKQLAILVTVLSVFLLFTWYNLRYLPVIDFLPYNKGTVIAEKMKIPEGASPDIYETTFEYEKDGVRKKFDISNYPANDSAWKFIDQHSVLKKKGYTPPIHDFALTTTNGEDITLQILSNKGYSVLMIARKIESIPEKRLQYGFSLGSTCSAASIPFYILTSSGSETVQKFTGGLTFCFCDETTLKTIVRSDPGYLLIKNGQIVGKWSWAGLPNEKWFTDLAVR